MISGGSLPSLPCLGLRASLRQIVRARMESAPAMVTIAPEWSLLCLGLRAREIMRAHLQVQKQLQCGQG